MELPLQCAWCRRAYGRTAIDEPPRDELLADAIHGLCPECCARHFARLRERAEALGDTGAARRAQRRGLAALAAYARRRAAAARANAEEIRRLSVDLLDRARALCASGPGGGRPGRDGLAAGPGRGWGLLSVPLLRMERGVVEPLGARRRPPSRRDPRAASLSRRSAARPRRPTRRGPFAPP